MDTTPAYKVLLQYYSVLHSTTTYYSSTTLYYKVLLQYYSVLQSTTPLLLWLQSTTPVLLCTTRYYSSTTLYYKVLLQYYSVLHSTVTTTYYSSTTLYYKVLLQYYSVLQSTTPLLLWLQSTTPVLFCTTRYYSSTTLYYKVLLQYYSVLHSTTTYYSSTTLYYKVLLQYYSVLQSTTPVLPCTTKYYSSTTLYCKMLLQYYPVLQSTTPVLLCTTQYYNVLLQYYSVLQITTPVLLCTAKYYSSTTLYYKVLLQYYSVLQSTTPVLLCTTQYYNVLLHYYPVLQSTTPVLLCTAKYYSSTTLYYTVLQRTTPVLLCTTKQHSWLILDTYEPSFTWLMSVAYETSFTMRGATGVILQLHQILHLPRKMTVMIDPRHIWNVIYNARSNRNHNPTSTNTAPATQNESHDWSASHMKRHLQWAEQQESQSNFTKYCACHAKWISWLIRVTYETSFTMRGATNVTGQVHQILRLPRKMNLIIDPPHIWNIIYNERSNKCHPPTSPNTASATQNESHDWSASDMKRHLQCAEQAKSTSNLTKYCACHAKWISWLIRVTHETSFTMRGASTISLQPHQILRLPRNSEFKISAQNPGIVSANIIKDDSTMIRAWSEHDPSMKSSSRTRRFGDLTRPILETIFYWKIQHFALRLSPKMSPNAAPATKSQPPTSPNTAPATKSLSSRFQRKVPELLPPIERRFEDNRR